MFSEDEDLWRWRLEEDGAFSVKSMYSRLETLMVPVDNLQDGERRVFAQIRKSLAPSKVVVFAWKLLHDRIPTKINLAIRNSLPPDSSQVCVLCNDVAEDSIHLFLHCVGVSVIWSKLMEWLDINIIIPPNLFIMWNCWNGAVHNKKIRKGVRLIWHAAIWSIWKARNDIIFNNAVLDFEALLESIKVLWWRWCLGRLDVLSCLFYEWSWNPKDLFDAVMRFRDCWRFLTGLVRLRCCSQFRCRRAGAPFCCYCVAACRFGVFLLVFICCCFCFV